MESKIYDYIQSVFRDVPKTERAETIRSEIFQNLVEKYRDLKEQGKSDDEAYAIAISSGGDLTGIVADLKGESVPYNYNYEKQFKKVYEKQYLREKKKCGKFNAWYWPAVACLYFVISFFTRSWAYSWIIFIAAVAGMDLFRFLTIKSHEKSRRAALGGMVWTGATTVYFILSFATMRWDITWLIFILAIAVSNVFLSLVFPDASEEDETQTEQEVQQ